MAKSIWRWSLLVVAMFGAGPLAAQAVGSVRAPDGGVDATILVSSSLGTATLMTLVALALAIGIGVLAAWRCSLRTGLFAAGLTLTWAAWSGARVDQVIRQAQDPGVMWKLAIEGAALGLVAIAAAYGLHRAALIRSKIDDNQKAAKPGLGLGLLVGVVLGGGAVWAVARSPLAGQALAAATAGGLVATVIGRVIDARTPTWAYIGVVVVLAVAGPASAAILHGDQIVQATYAGDLFPLARIAPLDWIAGAFLGVPMGSSWAASMTEKPITRAEGR